MTGGKRMTNTRLDRNIEEPIKKSWKVLFFGILALALMLGLGIYLLIEAFQKPKTPEDALDMKRMLISGIGVVLFTLALIIFLFSLYKPKRKTRLKSKRKSVSRNRTKRRTKTKRYV